MTRIEEIQKRCDDATPGPWEWPMNGECICDTCPILNEDDTSFVAHARTDIPYLLDMIKNLKREKKVLRDELLKFKQIGHEPPGIVLCADADKDESSLVVDSPFNEIKEMYKRGYQSATHVPVLLAEIEKRDKALRSALHAWEHIKEEGFDACNAVLEFLDGDWGLEREIREAIDADADNTTDK